MTTTPLPPFPRPSVFDPGRFGVAYSQTQMVEFATQARADLVAENQRLRGHLENLLCYDSYDQEYDGRMFAICPSCGGQEGEHTTQCEFEAARAALEKQP